MNSIVQKYHQEYKRCAIRRAEIQNALDEKESVIRRLKREINLLKSDLSAYEPPRWTECIEELAAQLASLYGKTWKMYGPFGLRSACTICLGDRADFDINKGAYASLKVIPCFESDAFVLCYDTGKLLQEYPTGSIGALNGFGREELPLPDSLEEIYQLFAYHPAIEE